MQLINVNSADVIFDISQELKTGCDKLVFYDNARGTCIEVPVKISVKSSKEANLLAKWLEQLIDISCDDNYDDEFKVEKMRSYCRCMLVTVEN